MADQLLFSLNVTHAMDALQDKLFESETKETLEFLSLRLEPNKCGKELVPGMYIIGAIHRENLKLEERKAIKNLTGRWPTYTATFTQLYHRHTVFRSTDYGRPDRRRDSTVCTFIHGRSIKYETIKKFCLTESNHLVLIQPFKINGSLLQTAGVPGRSKLERYKNYDLLSSFMAQVDTTQRPCVAVNI